MKIIKEISIAADRDEIWQWLTDKKKINIINGQGKSGFPNSEEINKILSSEFWIVSSVDTPNSLILTSQDPQIPLVSTYTLSEKGKKIALKVIIEGWEKLALDTIKNQMPQISLEWEKRLGFIKKQAESAKTAKVNQ